MIDLPKFTEVLVELDVTPMQVYFLYILYERDPISLIKYQKHREVDYLVIENLIQKDLILQTRKDSYEFNDLYVTNKFTRLFETDEEEHGEEFWKTYPDWILINGVKVSAKAINQEDLIAQYMKGIKKNLQKHKEIIKITQKWKENNNGYATMKISNYVGSKHYDVLIAELGTAQEEYEGKEI